MQDGKVLTQNGRHDLVEVPLDGKSYVYANMISKGLPKEEYIKTPKIVHEGKVYTGNAAYDLFKKR